MHLAYGHSVWTHAFQTFFENLEKNAETACYCLNIEQTFFMAIF